MEKEEAKMTDILNDWNDQTENEFTAMIKIMNLTFNDYLIFYYKNYTLKPSNAIIDYLGDFLCGIKKKYHCFNRGILGM